MTSLTLSLQHNLGGFRLGIEEEFSLQGVLGVLGPSGAGKTTLLRLLAGLEQPERGRLVFDTTCWLDTERGVQCPAHQRGVGFVFQDARLFPHLTVEENLRFAQQRAVRFGVSTVDIVEALELGSLMRRMPRTLSGGERQRVALGRTLMNRPRLLLLDEPVSAIDTEGRAVLLAHIRRLAKELGVPTIFVSHQVSEMAFVADELWVMRAGELIAQGPVAQVMNQLDLQEVSGASEAGSVLSAEVTAHHRDYQLTTLSFGENVLAVAGLIGTVGDSMRLRIQARDVAIATAKPDGLSIRNVLPATVTALGQGAAGPHIDVLLRCGDAELRARITRASADELALEAGQSVYALLKAVSVESP